MCVRFQKAAHEYNGYCVGCKRLYPAVMVILGQEESLIFSFDWLLLAAILILRHKGTIVVVNINVMYILPRRSFVPQDDKPQQTLKYLQHSCD